MLTPEQRAPVFSEEQSIAVVAGAGTGKTRVLTSRYLHLVESGVEMPRILAVTFTEKAAREMKNRIRDELPRNLAQDIEFAPISTIHAFLARLLRERAIDAGIDPRFSVADELTAELLLEAALTEAVAEMDLEQLVHLQGAERSLRELYLAARATPLHVSKLRWHEPDVSALQPDLDRFVEDCATQRATAAGTSDKLARIAALAPQLRAMEPETADAFHEAVKGGVAAAQRELFHEGKRIAKEWLAMRNLESARAVGEAIVDALVRIDERYEAKKRAEGLVDFSDLEHLGLALLRKIDVAAEYDHLLVDEYQDTSRIQEAILDKLAAGCHRFGVGDAKQSIYRFRYADAHVFADLQNDPATATYPLAGSFRSRPELVSFMNRLFGGFFSTGAVPPQDLSAAAAWRDKPLESVELLTVTAEKAADARRAEAHAIARRLRSIVKGGEVRRTLEDEEDRPLGYGDCAILLRAMTNLSMYERALTEAGVPYVVVMGRGYYAAREVVELAFLLSILGDPEDRYRATGVLTSLMCGVPEADLLHLDPDIQMPTAALHMDARGDRPAAIPDERWARLVTFGKRFVRWRDRAGRVETGALVEDILSQTRFADLLLLELDGRRRHANLMKALRRARQGQSDPATYARELLEFRERELRESEAPVAAEDDDAVKIMTVHAAKGLEFPLVVAADLTSAKGSSRGPILRPDGTFGFRTREGDVPGLETLKAWENAEEEDEQTRLLYVAFTRAQEHLILSGGRFEAKNCDTRIVGLGDDPPPELRVLEADSLVEAGGRRRLGASVRGALRRRADMPADLPREEAAAKELVQRVARGDPRVPNATPFVAAVADLVEYKRCPRRYRLGRMLGIEIEELGEIEGAEGRERADADEHPRRHLGTAFHEVMADIGPGAVPDAGTVREHFPEATDADVGKIVGWSEWLKEQEIARRLEGKTQLREMPFLARVSGLAVRGVIDLYAPELPLLLDYKTGARARPEEYEIQIAVYLAALRQLGHPAPEVGHLVYVDAHEVVEVPARSLADLISAYHDAHQGDGHFPPTPGEACVHCDYAKACIAEGVPCPRALSLF